MAREAISHSQALRVIGQRLHNAGGTAFELNKSDDHYLARISFDALVAPHGSRAIPHKSLGNCAGEMPVALKFTPVEILWSDDAQRQGRVRPGALADMTHLSVVLRVLGAYLDRKAAEEFTIAWSNDSVRVSFGNSTQNFSRHNIYDLAMVMYLQRYARAGKNQPRLAPNAIAEERPDFAIEPAEASHL